MDVGGSPKVGVATTVAVQSRRRARADSNDFVAKLKAKAEFRGREIAGAGPRGRDLTAVIGEC